MTTMPPLSAPRASDVWFVTICAIGCTALDKSSCALTSSTTSTINGTRNTMPPMIVVLMNCQMGFIRGSPDVWTH